jgi:hypothetical protein
MGSVSPDSNHSTVADVTAPAVVPSPKLSRTSHLGVVCRQTDGVSAWALLRLQTLPDSECPAPAPTATRAITRTGVTGP